MEREIDQQVYAFCGLTPEEIAIVQGKIQRIIPAMNKDLIIRMQGQFDQLPQTHPEEHHLEFCFARDLLEPLGYAR